MRGDDGDSRRLDKALRQDAAKSGVQCRFKLSVMSYIDFLEEYATLERDTYGKHVGSPRKQVAHVDGRGAVNAVDRGRESWTQAAHVDGRGAVIDVDCGLTSQPGLF